MRLVIGTLGLIAVAISGTASAGDLAPRTSTPPAYVAAVYDWSGFYIGANGGWGWANTPWNLQAPGGPFPEGSTNANGGTVGGQVGYRWQSGPAVFGIEAQGNWADLSGRNASLAALNAGFDNQSSLDGFGLFTGQVGYAWNNLLLYVKGGEAITGGRYSDLITGTSIVAGSSSDTRWGGVVGGGLEFGFAPNWSAAFEYDHLFMQNGVENLLGPTGVFASDSINQNADLVTARVNYRFGGPVIAKY